MQTPLLGSPDLLQGYGSLGRVSIEAAMSLLGHSRPMHSVPVPINVRCCSNSDIIVRRGEVTLRATTGPTHCNTIAEMHTLFCRSSLDLRAQTDELRQTRRDRRDLLEVMG